MDIVDDWKQEEVVSHDTRLCADCKNKKQQSMNGSRQYLKGFARFSKEVAVLIEREKGTHCGQDSAKNE